MNHIIPNPKFKLDITEDSDEKQDHQIKTFIDLYKIAYTAPNLIHNTYIFSTILKNLCNSMHNIEYESIECSQFIWFSILHFNKNAADAILKSMPLIQSFCEKNNITLPVNRGYPHAIHFAILSQHICTWSRDMYKYFTIVSISKIYPGCIIAWPFNSFGQNINQTDTGHVGVVTSKVGPNQKFYFGHSIPKNKDPKNKGGPTETIFSLNGNIITSINSALSFRGYSNNFDIKIDSYDKSYKSPPSINIKNVNSGQDLLKFIHN